MNGKHGVITAAFGSRKYVDMAADLGLSVKALSPLPISIVTGPSGARLIKRLYSGIFDQVIVGPQLDRLHGSAACVAAKLESIKNSPYQATVFLDSDMICTADPAVLLEDIDINDFRIFGRLHDKHSCGDVVHNGIPIIQLIDAFNLDSYVYCSLAAFGFGVHGASRVAKAMESGEPYWSDRMKQFGAAMPDEILIGLLGERTRVSFYLAPLKTYQKQDLSFRWSDEFSFIHSAPMRHREALRLLAGILRRRRRGGYPLRPSLFWLSDILNRKAEQLGRSRRQARATRLLVSYLYG